MKDVETILKALNTFDGYDAILYDANTGNIVRFQDVVDLITWQNSEIEQLKQAIGCYVADQEVYVSGYRGTQAENERLKAEIERLTEENRRDVFNLNTRICELDNENAEIQKQVDELNKQLQDMEEQRDNQAYIAEELVQEKHRWTEQVVKDTAKEILQGTMNIIKKSGGFLAEEVIRIWAKRYGVEVEQ